MTFHIIRADLAAPLGTPSSEVTHQNLSREEATTIDGLRQERPDGSRFVSAVIPDPEPEEEAEVEEMAP